MILSFLTLALLSTWKDLELNTVNSNGCKGHLGRHCDAWPGLPPSHMLVSHQCKYEQTLSCLPNLQVHAMLSRSLLSARRSPESRFQSSHNSCLVPQKLFSKQALHKHPACAIINPQGCFRHYAGKTHVFPYCPSCREM